VGRVAEQQGVGRGKRGIHGDVLAEVDRPHRRVALVDEAAQVVPDVTGGRHRLGVGLGDAVRPCLRLHGSGTGRRALVVDHVQELAFEDRDGRHRAGRLRRRRGRHGDLAAGSRG